MKPKGVSITRILPVILAFLVTTPELPRAELLSVNFVLILDCSWSMRDSLEGTAKIDIAKNVLIKFIDDLKGDVRVGLIAYGQGHQGRDCSDVQELIPLSPLTAISKRALIDSIMAIHPKGATPLSLSIKTMADRLKALGEPATIVLISDGQETCGGEPCAEVKKVKESGINFIMHVVGFDINEEEKAQLMCIANASGGLYFHAVNAEQLGSVINNIWDIRISKEHYVRPYKAKGEEIRVGQGIIKMIWVPGGTFKMECHSGKVSEGISRTVTLSNFLMSETEVTQAQYEAVKNTNPSRFKGDSHRPVECVSWYDAVSYCNQLSVQEELEPCYNLSTWECAFSKKGFRLPTEAEWEYACRAGTRTAYYTGESETDLNQAGWCAKNANETTHTVKLKRPNEWGLYDLHGNVCEWCNDWFLTTYYRLSSMYNPEGPPVGKERVCRGGSWADSDDISCRVNYRKFNDPGANHESMGFRVVRRP